MTDKQKQILILVAQDFPIKTIAEIFGISTKTVEYHWSKIKTETGIKTPVASVYYCLDNGLIELKKKVLLGI